MRHIIFFCYMCTILIGVSAITIQWLAEKEKRFSKEMTRFIVILLIMNLYDMFIYYNDYIFHMLDSILLLRIGDCTIAIIVLFWLKEVKHLIQKSTFDWIPKITGYYIIGYVLVWITSTFIINEGDAAKWLYAAIEVGIVILLIFGSGAFIKEGISRKIDKGKIYYISIVTVMMTFSYISYFASEIRVSWGHNQYDSDIMDITVFYWFIINIANLIVIYRLNFKKKYKAGQTAMPFDLEKALDELQERYDLTGRERELAKQIYEGKSNSQIAQDLYISESTVKTHIYNIFRKLDVKNRVEVVCSIRGEKKEDM